MINLLPCLDPYLMGYAERERYLNSEYATYVFDRSGNATSTILVDGRVVGVWDYRGDGQELVKLLFFYPIEPEPRHRIHELARGLGRFVAQTDVAVEECESMVPLTTRSAGSFLSPLKHS